MVRTSQKTVLEHLRRLVRLNRESEKGFRVAAECVSNRGLKVLLKSCAQQHAEFARELEEQLQRLGASPAQRTTPLALIHRGWIIIKATMTAGPQETERVVLGECSRGGHYILAAYEAALGAGLPQEVAKLLDRQREALAAVHQQIEELKGIGEKQLVVRLFDSSQDVAKALEALEASGLTGEEVNVLAFDKVMTEYPKDIRGVTIAEAVSSASLSGAVLGGIIGALVGVSILLVPEAIMEWQVAPLTALGLATVAGMLVGGLFGALFGLLIGSSVAEEDEFLYDDSLAHGESMLMVCADHRQADQVATVLKQINAARA